MRFRCDGYVRVCVNHALEQSRPRPRTSYDEHIRVTHPFTPRRPLLRETPAFWKDGLTLKIRGKLLPA
jgi:hypothetical protein